MKRILTSILCACICASCSTPMNYNIEPDAGNCIKKPDYLIGVNLAGAEFTANKLPGKVNFDYVYPSTKDLDYFQKNGINLIRLPFLWERIQPKLNNGLSTSELNNIRKLMDEAAKRKMYVILDLHNYGAYKDHGRIGSSKLPNKAFADIWTRLAKEFKTHPALWAYGLMNEPVQMEGKWPAAAQAAVDAIRKVDKTNLILVGGDFWSSAMAWRQNNEKLRIKDPVDNIRYEAHLYFDHDSSGTYQKGGYEKEGAKPNIGSERLKNYIAWLKENKARGFIGEYGIPSNDPRWLTVMDNTLKTMADNCIPSTYWAAGPWWGNYPLSIQPNKDGTDKPQMSTLRKYAKSPPKQCTPKK